MRIPPALAAKLDSRRHDALRAAGSSRAATASCMGFTDHDAISPSTGHAVPRRHRARRRPRRPRGSGSRSTARRSRARSPTTRSTEADLAAGRYDARRHRSASGRLERAVAARAAARRACSARCGARAQAFTAEVRALAHRLDEESGRLYTATCSADLGDARCRSISTNPAFRGSGAVAALAGASAFHASGLDAFADGWFTGGKLTLHQRRECRLRRRGEDASRRARRRADRAVAAAAGAARAGRRVHA